MTHLQFEVDSAVTNGQQFLKEQPLLIEPNPADSALSREMILTKLQSLKEDGLEAGCTAHRYTLMLQRLESKQLGSWKLDGRQMVNDALQIAITNIIFEIAHDLCSTAKKRDMNFILQEESLTETDMIIMQMDN